jgi:hypothetical protein
MVEEALVCLIFNHLLLTRLTFTEGNIGTTPSDFDAPSLDTPTLKGEMYTTGRGGSGNMAKNVDPEATRRAQDVVGYVTLFCLSLIFLLLCFFSSFVYLGLRVAS